MHTIRYSTDGNWYKGNTHIHSIKSDGGLDYHQLAKQYAEAGYSFLVFTDHWYVSTAESIKDFDLLAINGVEIDGKDQTGANYHVVGFGFEELELDGKSFMPALELLREKNALRILAHPYWMGNSIDDALRHNFDGVEVYNNVCHFLNGKSSGAFHWDCLLKNNHNVLGFSVDDAHIRAEYPTWNGGWIMVNADSLTKENMLEAIRKGDFYSSQGPEFKHIKTSESAVKISTSKVKEIRLVGSNSSGQRIAASDEAGLREAEFDITGSNGYLRLEIEDYQNRRAWTNSLFR